MLRTRTLLPAALALAMFTWTLRAQEDEARALVLKAVEAHGGQKALAKYQAAQVKYKADLDFMNVKAKMSGEVAVQFPHKIKNTVMVEVNNMNIDVVSVFDGKKVYVKAAGMVMELDDAKVIAEAKETLYAEKVANLADLTDKGYKFSPLGEAKVAGAEASGVRVSRDGHRDVNLYFDKKSHMLVKYEYRGQEPVGMMEVAQEKILSGYKDIMGIKTAMKIVVHYDGKQAMEMEVTEVSYAERLDDSFFAKP